MRGLTAFLLALSLTGCGGLVGFNGSPSGDPVTVSGTVTAVHVSSDGSFQFTFVTLATNGGPNQFTFCGNTAAQFPMNTSVTVHFNPGQNCNQIVVVITG